MTEITRSQLQRQLAVNAATKPLNIAAPAAVLVVGLLLHVLVIAVPVAVVAYLALVLQTFFDADEAERVGKATYARADNKRPQLDESQLSPEIRLPLRQAREVAAGIRAAVAESDVGLQDVVSDVDALVAAMETSARRAQRIADTLADQARAGQDEQSLDREIKRRQKDPDPDVKALVADLRAQREATARLRERLERFQVGMQRICASLGLLRTRVAEMDASEEEAAQKELGAQARELRERTDLLAESMAEVFQSSHQPGSSSASPDPV
jgi:hypothetical protein